MEVFQLRWGSLVLVAIMCGVCLLVFRFKWGLRSKVGVVVALLLCAAWVVIGIATDYNIILLAGEEDDTAERAFNYLDKRLSDARLARLLSQGERGHPYLASNNVRFYLALMAARRGLHEANAAELGQPRFFASNSYSVFANGLHFPVSYEQLRRSYQEAAARPPKQK